MAQTGALEGAQTDFVQMLSGAVSMCPSTIGSKADICAAIGYVRLTYRSGHSLRQAGCPLRANSAHRKARYPVMSY
jgi:hypothetical protein